MFRASGLTAEFVHHLTDGPSLRQGKAEAAAAGLAGTGPSRPDRNRGAGGFARAVLELAALSLSAGSLLAVRS